MAKTEFQQELSSASANSVYLLKTEDDIITGILSLEQGVDVNKHLTNLQEHIYTMGDIIGIVGEGDPNAKIYASTNYVANGDDRKVAIEKLDAQAKISADAIAANLVLITTNASDISDIIASIGLDALTAPIGVGICPLDNDGKIPSTHLPDVLLEYKGTWDASTNTPTLADGTGSLNDWYRVNVAGTVDLGSGSISYEVGDKVVHNGTIWEKWDTVESVISVHGRQGAVVAQAGDYNATQVGLGNVTNDAQLKRAAGDLNTFTEKATPVEDDIVIIEDSEDTFNKKKVKLANMLGGSGGGGSFLFELTGDISPLESIYKGISLLDFDFESKMEALALVTVPASYSAGKQITLENTAFFSASAADNIYFRCNTSLIKAGADITAALNEHLSTNTEVTLSTANAIEQVGSLDLTDGSGEINAVAVAPGDILLIKLFRDNDNETTSAAEDGRLLKFSPSVKYDN